MNGLFSMLNVSWRNILTTKQSNSDFFSSPQLLSLEAFLQDEYAHHTIYPAQEDMFAAFQLCPFENVRVVIVGQDPYHGEGQAHGLAFSVNNQAQLPQQLLPPSLKNIFKEIAADVGESNTSPDSTSGNLTPWAQQGVLLLNTVLTVRKDEAGSHRNKGWELFTDMVISTISAQHEHVVFILWGNDAQTKNVLIDQSKHLVLTAAHPSPLSAYRGFFGCKHFSATNEYLRQYGKKEIMW